MSFRGHQPYQFRSDDGSCSKLAPGLMFDDFLPDAEFLPFYPFVLKLACVRRESRNQEKQKRKVPNTTQLVIFALRLMIFWPVVQRHWPLSLRLRSHARPILLMVRLHM